MVLGMYFKTGKTITLSDKLGNDALTVNDSDGFPVHKLDSLGHHQMKGSVKRTLTG